MAITLYRLVNTETMGRFGFFEVHRHEAVAHGQAAAEGRACFTIRTSDWVSVAALTLYDMLKAVDRAIVIGPVFLAEKRGGRSGEYRRARGR